MSKSDQNMAESPEVFDETQPSCAGCGRQPVLPGWQTYYINGVPKTLCSRTCLEIVTNPCLDYPGIWLAVCTECWQLYHAIEGNMQPCPECGSLERRVRHSSRDPELYEFFGRSFVPLEPFQDWLARVCPGALERRRRKHSQTV